MSLKDESTEQKAELEVEMYKKKEKEGGKKHGLEVEKHRGFASVMPTAAHSVSEKPL